MTERSKCFENGCNSYCFIYDMGRHSSFCENHLKPCTACKGSNTFGGGMISSYCRKCCEIETNDYNTYKKFVN